MIKPVSHDFSTKRILIVDDDDYLAKILRSILEIFEISSIQMSETVTDAITKIEKGNFDCIFVDNMLADETGLDLTKKMRQSDNEAIKQTPVILYSAYTGMQSIINARDAGVTEVLAKPISPEQILAKLTNALYYKREFIVSGDYLGPDRRRRIRDVKPEEDRRSVKLPPEQHNDRPEIHKGESYDRS